MYQTKIHQTFSNLCAVFLSNCGVQDKIIGFISLLGEISDLQCAMLKEVSDKFALQNKIVALCADNANANFGGCKILAKIMCGENLKLN
jgi:hypothetical protein